MYYIVLSRSCGCCAECWLREVQGANSDAAMGAEPNHREQSCACYCKDSSDCMAADYNLHDRTCHRHPMNQNTQGRKPYPQCNRYEYTCGREYIGLRKPICNGSECYVIKICMKNVQSYRYADPCLSPILIRPLTF